MKPGMALMGAEAVSFAMSGTGRAVRGSPASSRSSAARHRQHLGVTAARADDLEPEGQAGMVAP
jgi:hypothetical protein